METRVIQAHGIRHQTGDNNSAILLEPPPPAKKNKCDIERPSIVDAVQIMNDYLQLEPPAENKDAQYSSVATIVKDGVGQRYAVTKIDGMYHYVGFLADGFIMTGVIRPSKLKKPPAPAKAKPKPEKYDTIWEGSVKELVAKVASSDARQSFYDKASGSRIFINIDDVEEYGPEVGPPEFEPFYIVYGENTYDAYNQDEAIMILMNIRKGAKYPDQPPPPAGANNSPISLDAPPPAKGAIRTEFMQLAKDGVEKAIHEIEKVLEYSGNMPEKSESYHFDQIVKILDDLYFAQREIYTTMKLSPPPIALSPEEATIPGFAEDLESCVLQVKEKGDGFNPYAVCRSSLRTSHGLD